MAPRACLVLLVTVVVVAALPANRVAMEADVPPLIPTAWTKAGLGETFASQEIGLTFAVKQENLQELEDTLARVSNPTSEHYGEHLSLRQVNTMVKPEKSAIAKVMRFLEAHGVAGRCATENCDFIQAVVNISTANAMLDARYEAFAYREDTSVVSFATEKYSLPAEVAQYVDFVSPAVRLPTPMAARVDSAASRHLLGGAGGGNTPASLRALYSIGDVEGTGATKQAATGFLKQYFRPSDLQKFYSSYYKAAEGRELAAKGDKMGGSAGVEASLDVDYISTVGGNVTTEFWSFDGTAPDNPANEPFLAFMLLVGNTSDSEVPHVFSTSYGENEASVSLAYSSRINVEFQKAGVRGISLMFASGDDGVGSTCKDGKFDSKWPAASPYVTAVGGTEGSKVPEKVAGLSSGGFSYRYAQPSWQKAAVEAYLTSAQGVPAESHFNKSGRAFPDVSAQAVNFVVVNNGMTLPGVAGTSAACPTFSGVIGLLNDLRGAAGKKPLGFLNPWIYQNMDAFNDVTTGSNPGCSSEGFPAAKGFDPATGVGTPNYAKMAKAMP